MFGNSSLSDFFILESLGLPPAYVYPAFLFGTLCYLMIVFCNVLVLTTIAVSKKLHKPMFILLFNLPISDLLGATAFFPHLVYSILTQNRGVSIPACVFQAFCIHVYGTGNLVILSAMAYDRYIAICCPLKYNTIMSRNNLMKIIVLIWLITFLVMFSLFILLVRLKFCGADIVDLYCNNPSLMNVTCEDSKVNNYYGMATIILIMGGPLLIIIYTYAQILRTCMMTNQPDARKKAIQTCGTHLAIFIVLQINTVFTLISHRLQNASPFIRRAFGVSILIFPPILDPIVYGLKTQELKQNMLMFLKRSVSLTK